MTVDTEVEKALERGGRAPQIQENRGRVAATWRVARMVMVTAAAVPTSLRPVLT
jgi:hypothetical protein